MHEFFLMHAAIHLLACLTLAFFILFAAGNAEGLVKLFGNILGIIFILLGIAGLAFGVMHMHGGDHDKDMMGRMHGWGPPWMHHDDDASPNTQATPTPPAAPATPAPANPAPKKP